MDFDVLLNKVTGLLEAERRVSYAALRRRFDMSDDDVEAIKDELVHARRQAHDENGKVLVWSTDMERRAGEAERRQLTVMFCDLKDSTELSGRLDPEDLRAVIRGYQAAADTVIHRFGGHIAQYLGDGLLVYFGYPRAHEDDAQRAVRAGLGIVNAVKTLNRRLRSRFDLTLGIRLGIHTGLVVVGEVGAGERSETLALGKTPNLAARLEQIAEPGTVAISDTTRRLLEDRFYVDDLGPQVLKGIPEPVQAYRVLGDTGVRSRFDIAATQAVLPLVGRRAELARLVELWERAKLGSGQVALVSGEPGIGKSRLVEALKEHVGRENSPWGSLRCSPYFRDTALYPVVELWQQQLELNAGQEDAHKLRRLEDSLRRYGLDLDDAVPLFAGLLSIAVPDGRYPPVVERASQRRVAAIELLAKLVFAMAGGRPFLFVVEDLQWIDPTTAELLTRVAGRIEDQPLLAVYTSRPELRAHCHGVGHVSRIPLARLDSIETAGLARAVAGVRSLPDQVLKQIVERTDGVPAFVEELTRSVLESGLLRGTADGALTSTGPQVSLGIPETLRDSLMARLDRLGEAKRVAQLAAVIGRWFSFELMRAVSPLGEAALRGELDRLVDAGLLRQWGEDGTAHYMFRHALIQELAYESLLRSTRQKWHAHIAGALLEHFPELAAARPELLAHHFTASAETALAVREWHRAGRQAQARSMNEEAIAHIERALELTAASPPTPERDTGELGLLLSLGPSQLARFGWGAAAVGTTYSRARELSVRLGADGGLRMALIGLLGHALLLADYDAARSIGRDLDALAQRDGSSEARLAAHCALGSVHMQTGELEPAERLLSAAVACGRESAGIELLHGQDPGVTCGAWLGLVLWLRGQPGRALVATDAAITLGRTLNHPLSLAFALSWGNRVYALHGDAAHAAVLAEECNVLARQHGFSLFEAASTISLGLARVQGGDHAAGLAMIRQGLEAWRGTGAQGIQPYFLSVLADACLHASRREEAARALSQGLESARSTGEIWWQPELERLEGELALTADGGEERAETAFSAAQSTARGQGAIALVLRAALGLAEARRRQGLNDAAFHALDQAVRQCPESDADTADLRRARALLEILDDLRRAS